MDTGIQIGFSIINTVLLLGGIAGFVLFIIVLVKINKALDIWLEKNKRN